MRLEDQVCSLELAKKLKELGVKQKSIFVWEYYDDKCYGVKFIPYAVVPDINNKFQLFSAFTVSELGGMLPSEVYEVWKDDEEITGESHNRLFMQKCIDETYSYYYQDGNDPELIVSDDKNESNARAKILIYLIGNNLIKVPE